VSQSGWTISRDCGCIVDVVIVLENSVLLAGDLAREISNPLGCHFVRSELRNVWMGDYDRREGFPTAPPSHRGRVVLIDAVLLDKAEAGGLIQQAEYTGAAGASKKLVGYEGGGQQGRYRNLPYVAASSPGASRAAYQGPDRKVSRG
jgi:hypothetical protein